MDMRCIGMLITIVEVAACENPRCAQFARPIEVPRSARTHYCSTCGLVSSVRGVDARLLASREAFAGFLRKAKVPAASHPQP